MKMIPKTLVAVAVLATAGLAFAQADSTTGRSNRSDPSQMTTPPAGAEPNTTNRHDTVNDRRLEERSVAPVPGERRSTTRRQSAPDRAADPSQMTTHPEGSRPK